MKISVFTVCLPDYNPEDAAKKLASWKADGVEWRIQPPAKPGTPINFWGGNFCSLHPEELVESAPAVKKLCRKYKLAMPALGSYLNCHDLKSVETVMAGAQALGAKMIRVGVDGYDGKTNYEKVLKKNIKAYEKVVRLGKKYKVLPTAEIHMGNIIPSCSAARRFIENFKPAEAGIIHDAGNMVYEGFENWQMGMELLGPYMKHVHVKNASWRISGADRDGNLRWNPEADTLRNGRVNWADLVSLLKKVKYTGYLSLEDFSAGNTDDKLKDDIKYLRQLIKRKN